MTLIAIREQFVKFTGRYDLVVDTDEWQDNGADFFITSGQRWLERRATVRKSSARHYVALEVGAWYALIPSCRAIHEVWVSNAVGEKWKLTKKSLTELRNEFADSPTLIDSGALLYYCPVSVRVSPEEVDITQIDHFGTEVFETDTDHFSFDGLVFLPPAEESLALEVHGNFFQLKLEEDNDANYWSEEEPFILVLAACRALEISYRNTAGVRDWESAIDDELRGLEFDLVDQQSSEISRIEG
jgi:hypothetical protein